MSPQLLCLILASKLDVCLLCFKISYLVPIAQQTLFEASCYEQIDRCSTSIMLLTHVPSFKLNAHIHRLELYAVNKAHQILL